MPEHLIGYIIIGLSVVLTSIMLFIRWRWWTKRWTQDTRLFSGHLCRFDYGAVSTPEIERELEVAAAILDKYIGPSGLMLTTEIIPWRIEVVTPGNVRTPTIPAGVFSDKSIVGGSIRTERFLPITKKYHVAVIVNERVGAFLAHEVARHIIAFAHYGILDPFHKNEILGNIERLVKAEIVGELGVQKE